MFRVWLFLLFCLGGAHAQTILRLDWGDAARNRAIPVKIFLPAQSGPRPVLIVSHGLGGSREGLDYLGETWSKSGFLCVHAQHFGSDEALWRGAKTPFLNLQRAVKDPQNAINRAQDVSFLLDELTRQNAGKSSPLRGRCDLSKIGVAGHSFGAWTALAVSGRGRQLRDARIKACLALSAPTQGLAREKQAFAGYRTPTLFWTGTRDDSPISQTKAAQRREPFDALAGSTAFLGILEGATHATFGGAKAPRGGENVERDQRLILESSQLFWRAFLLSDSKAKRELENFGGALGGAGTWEQK